jgi:hypothetical protein
MAIRGRCRQRFFWCLELVEDEWMPDSLVNPSKKAGDLNRVEYILLNNFLNSDGDLWGGNALKLAHLIY